MCYTFSLITTKNAYRAELNYAKKTYSLHIYKMRVVLHNACIFCCQKVVIFYLIRSYAELFYRPTDDIYLTEHACCVLYNDESTLLTDSYFFKVMVLQRENRLADSFSLFSYLQVNFLSFSIMYSKFLYHNDI